MLKECSHCIHCKLEKIRLIRNTSILSLFHGNFYDYKCTKNNKKVFLDDLCNDFKEIEIKKEIKNGNS